jgi:hypothetical protein
MTSSDFASLYRTAVRDLYDARQQLKKLAELDAATGIVASINNGANAGTVQLRFGVATNTQSNGVLINSYMTARRIG